LTSLTLKVVSESHVSWATSVPILVFLGLSVLEVGPMYATDRRQTDGRQTDDKRQTDVRQKHRLMPSPYGGGGINFAQYLNNISFRCNLLYIQHSLQLPLPFHIMRVTFSRYSPPSDASSTPVESNE